MADSSATAPFACTIDGEPPRVEDLHAAATVNYGHITILQVRDRMARGLQHHLDRLDAANFELFGRSIDQQRVRRFLAMAVAERRSATVRINVFATAPATPLERVMITLTDPVESVSRPAHFSLIPYERDMPGFKHVASMGLIVRQKQAAASGLDGAVFFDRDGNVSEATLWNVGFFDGEAIVWPAARSLIGITQTIIREGLTTLGIPMHTEAIRIDRLDRYRSAFLTNSSTFGRPLASVGNAKFAVDESLNALLLRAYELTPLMPCNP